MGEMLYRELRKAQARFAEASKEHHAAQGDLAIAGTELQSYKDMKEVQDSRLLAVVAVSEVDESHRCVPRLRRGVLMISYCASLLVLP